MAIRSEAHYAGDARSVSEALKEQRAVLEGVPHLMELLDGVSDFVMVLNERGQIVTANESLLKMLHVPNSFLLRGLWPGEALRCVHAFMGERGCGAAKSCGNCGLDKVILAGRNGTKMAREYSIRRGDGIETLEVRASARPMEIAGHQYTILSLSDIKHERRRRVLERVFFHNIVNLVGSLRGFSELMKGAEGEELEEYRETVCHLAERLLEEVNAQKDLAAAENNQLALRLSRLNSLEILGEVLNSCRAYDPGAGGRIRIDPAAHDIAFVSDGVLLERILRTMVENALEASREDETVTLGCTVSDEIRFHVHNPGFIPRQVQQNIFKPSFSTKGKNRGTGTYAMKLLTERYLHGTVYFETSASEGTLFVASFPITDDDPASSGRS